MGTQDAPACPEVPSIQLSMSVLLTSVLPRADAMSSMVWPTDKYSRGFSSAGHQLLINHFSGGQLLPVCRSKCLSCQHGMALLYTGERPHPWPGLRHSEKQKENKDPTFRPREGKGWGAPGTPSSHSFLLQPCCVPGGGQCSGQCVFGAKMQWMHKSELYRIFPLFPP